MNDGVLLVNFAALGQAGADIERALQKMRADLDELKAKGDELTATWSGAAKDSYQERQDKWTKASADLEAILRQIQGAVVDSQEDYANAERAGAQRFA